MTIGTHEVRTWLYSFLLLRFSCVRARAMSGFCVKHVVLNSLHAIHPFQFQYTNTYADVRAYTWQRIRASANASELVLVAVTNGVLVPLFSDDSVVAVFVVAISSIAKNILHSLWRVRAVEFVSTEEKTLAHTYTGRVHKKPHSHLPR